MDHDRAALLGDPRVAERLAGLGRVDTLAWWKAQPRPTAPAVRSAPAPAPASSGPGADKARARLKDKEAALALAVETGAVSPREAFDIGRDIKGYARATLFPTLEDVMGPEYGALAQRIARQVDRAATLFKKPGTMPPDDTDEAPDA